MTLGPLLTEVVVTFCVATYILYNYGNWMKHHIVVTLAVLVAWYFSFLIVFILPLDVSSTVFRQCIQESLPENVTSLGDNSSLDFLPLIVNGSTVTPSTAPWLKLCQEPWSYVPEQVFPNLWRVVYWTSQCLTWLVLPLMQSYIKAGDFTVRGKLRSALIDNAIYYGSYLLICGILLVYIALKPGLDLDGQKLKAIASSASNTWGLLLLVLLLGYALVEVPRSLWNASKRGYLLNYSYFKAAKLSSEKCEAEETVDDVLESLQAVCLSISPGHPLHRNLETILQKVPVELRQRMGRRQLPDDTPLDPPNDRALARLHKQVIKSLQTQHRTETQWGLLADRIIDLEDVARNQVGHERRYKASFRPHRPSWQRCLYNPTIEWYWKCVFHGYFLKAAAIFCGILSAAVVWSEVTFFNKEPVLSLFARFVNLAKEDYDYFTIEVVSTLIIAYLCYCAYSTVLQIRFLNLYYLAPHHQTDEYSLVFSGMMLCRLTPPMCLNFLGLIHMDSHIIKQHILETHYTQVMGHMDVISIISDGFNVYFPMAMLAFCFATYFSIGARVLSFVGWQQFVGDDEVTADLVDEGRELIKRERRRKQRVQDTMDRMKEFQDRFGTRYRPPRQKQEDRVRPMPRDDSSESARTVLLRDVELPDYSAHTNTNSSLGSDRSYERASERSYERTRDRPQDQGRDRLFSGERDLTFSVGDRDALFGAAEVEDDLSYQSTELFPTRGRVGPPPRGLFDDV